MEKNQKELKGYNSSGFCGDGSCGCGCDEIAGGRKILSKEELRKIRSLLKTQSQKIHGPHYSDQSF